MTRQDIIDGFHKLYLQKIAEETQKRGIVRKGGGIPIEALKQIHNDTIAEWGQKLLEYGMELKAQI